MARYVLIEFDDDARAMKLVEMMRGKTGIKIRGLFAAPRVFCKCTKVKGRGWTRGLKLGWWVCNVCRRPSRQWGSSAQAVVGQAVNLLPELQQALATPFPPTD